jgi:hypothetical protein
MTCSRSAGGYGGGGDHWHSKAAVDSSKVISQVTPTLVLRMWVVFIKKVDRLMMAVLLRFLLFSGEARELRTAVVPRFD